MTPDTDIDNSPRYLRLDAELVVEIIDHAALTEAALAAIDEDDALPHDERAHTREAVRRDEAEALAYLVDPFDLLNGVPGVELTQASWSSAHTDFEPEEPGNLEWDPGEGA